MSDIHTFVVTANKDRTEIGMGGPDLPQMYKSVDDEDMELIATFTAAEKDARRIFDSLRDTLRDEMYPADDDLLRKYGHHAKDCKIEASRFTNSFKDKYHQRPLGPECTCGWDKIKEAL